MGSHIDTFFPHCIERSSATVRAKLNFALGPLVGDLVRIRDRGRFSTHVGDWSLWDEEGTITGEGPNGFQIRVYSSVVEFTSLERFGAVERPDQGINVALRRVFEAVAAEFGGGGRLAVTTGGYGETDKAGDLALAGAGFDEVCVCLEAVIGPPARSWATLELGANGWYLNHPTESPRDTAHSG